MLRHAYLIMIHKDSLALEYTLRLLDDENNGIYIHVDKNAAHVDLDKIRGITKKSPVSVYRKYKVYWGTNSITLAELFLLKKAIKGKYDYYHILSGADMPIKSKQEIQRFFERHNGKEFIHFGTRQYQRDIIERYRFWHFFQKQLGRERDKKFWVAAETYSLAVQRRLHTDRTKRTDYSFYGGANWCSITRAFAEYVTANDRKYRKAFRQTQISDEAIWQTILMDSPFRENLYKKGFDNDYRACMRYIDWDRGSPYVFRREDFDSLMASEHMFARKFDEDTDREIMEMIYRAVGEESGK
ncbi:MAG: beta-1,6-N-acetylglucosaminyltransferase [Roseburia sp.]|nr:beta-1,6-N-acetylglucosaminyltransferase [Roseburia sp.]